MRKIRFLLFAVITLLSCIGCSEHSPKPVGYFRVELEKPTYSEYSNDSSCFSFFIPSNAEVVGVADTSLLEEWMNIVYPSLNARIYCSYLSITPSTFRNAAEDSRKFVYVHAVKADAIEEKTYFSPENRIFGIIYNIKGNVASPVQFVLTDSTQHFFRGALYFDCIPNQDSVAPVLDHIQSDIQELITSFRWKDRITK